mgnify:CR=1 FL=1
MSSELQTKPKMYAVMVRFPPYVNLRIGELESLCVFPYRICISTIFSNLPPALQAAFATCGVIVPRIKSDMSPLISFAKSFPVTTPFEAIVKLRVSLDNAAARASVGRP